MEKPAALPTGEHPWAKSLRRYRKVVTISDLIVSIIVTIALFSGWAGRLADLAMSQTPSPWLRALIFAAGLGLVYGIPAFPLSFVKGYLIEKKFGLSTQTIGAWVLDQLKGLVLAAVLGTVVLSGLVCCLVWAGNHWWWVAAIFAMLFGVVLTRVAPQWIVPLFFKMKPLANETLQQRFKALADRTGTPVLGIYEIDLSRRTKAANAAVIGFGASRRAVVGDTLLESFNDDEVEFVLAHELGHHHYNDLWSGVALSSMLTLLALALTHLLLTRNEYFVVPFPPTTLNFNPVLIYWIAVSTTLIGMVTGPISKFVSRFMEARADRFATEATGKAPAGAEAFRKLGYQNLAVFQPPRWEELLMYTHPSIARRIARLSS